MKQTRNIVIIGGGAAGLAAAITAARAGAPVTVFEAGKRVGSKILKTGNGRCNLTNMHVQPADYNDLDFVAPVLDAWSAGRVREFFETLGLMSVEEDEGRVYPLSNSANSVLDVLRFECERFGVKMFCEHEVVDVEVHESVGDLGDYAYPFALTCANGARFDADRIIVATGGGTSLLKDLGHAIVPFQPVLCSLKTDTRPLKGLSGVRVHALVRAFRSDVAIDPVAELSGEVLFRDYGISGIVIFDMSRLVEAGDMLSLDFLPHLSVGELESWLLGRYELLRSHADDWCLPISSYSELMSGLLHTRLNDALVRMAGCRPSEPADVSKLPVIAAVAKDFRLRVEGPGDPKQAQVTRGGASAYEFDPVTLESKLVPGVYAVGETLNVDGRCGGFNLHWAWASGITAAAAAAS